MSSKATSSVRRLPSRSIVLGGLLIAASLAPFAPTWAGEATDAIGTTTEIRTADLEQRLSFLASEELGGRETTKAGAWLAAEYIAGEMARFGLEPAGDDGTFFQGFAVKRPVLGEGNRLEIHRDGETTAYHVEEDWNPFSVTASAEVKAPVVFAGYGITAPGRRWKDGEGRERVGWDDYARIDVKGRIVLVLRKNPGWRQTRHATFLAKLSNAVKHGAVGLLLCNNPDTTKGGEDRIGHWSAPVGAPSGSGQIPYAFVSQDVARMFLASAGEAYVSLDELEARLRREGPQSTALPGDEVMLRTVLTRTEQVNARNVAGLLPGTDPDLKDEVLVIGAHHDHVGLGTFGSLGGADASGRVHPGADDNGSGSVALLELAEHFGHARNRPRRPILFLTFTGEEMGLLGSRYYVEHPIVPLDRTVAMLNMDMVGRSRERRLQVGGVGTARGLRGLVATANEPHRLVISWDPQGMAPSDSASFFRKKIPVLFFFTGIHEDYHRPSDTVDRIDYETLASITRLVGDTARAIANADDRLVYTDPPPIPRPPILGVRLGPEADPRGIAVAGVTPGGPAAQAGLQEGDVIVALAGQIVRTPMDLRSVLVRLKPGKAIPLVVLRGDERMTIEIVPAERRPRGG